MAEGDTAPRRRAFLLHRLALAIPRAAADGLQDTAATLAEWHATLIGRWGPVELPLALRSASPPSIIIGDTP